MRRPSRTGMSWACIFIAVPLAAQNLDGIGREKLLAFSGGLAINHVFYHSNSGTSGRAPYSFLLSANSNLALLGWSIPLGLSLSNHSAKFRQPFNQYSIHPRWKWITVHAGYTAVSFSPYTVNGHVFKGIAIDLTPGSKWLFNVLYGRFVKMIRPDSASHLRPAYQRNGYGFRVGYGGNENSVHLVIFRARDADAALTTSSDVSPMDNLAASLSASKVLFSRFIVKTEIASSVLTRDRTNEGKSTYYTLTDVLPLITVNRSTAEYTAVKGSIRYRNDTWEISTGYERIDPGYQTLGAYYFNNDLESFTLNGSTRFLNETLAVSGSAGLQRDNIDNSRTRTMRRIAGASHINYAPSANWNMSVMYSTFQTFTGIKHLTQDSDLVDQADTLGFTQISGSAALSALYSFSPTDTRKQILTLNVNWNESKDIQEAPHSTTSTVCFFSIGYSNTSTPTNSILSLAINATLGSGAVGETRMLGPSITLGKSVFSGRCRTALSASWQKMKHAASTSSSVFTARFNSTFAMRGNHNLALNILLMRRSPKQELTATLGYQYSLSSGRR